MQFEHKTHSRLSLSNFHLQLKQNLLENAYSDLENYKTIAIKSVKPPTFFKIASVNIVMRSYLHNDRVINLLAI